MHFGGDLEEEQHNSSAVGAGALTPLGSIAPGAEIKDSLIYLNISVWIPKRGFIAAGNGMCDFDQQLFTGAMSRLIGGALDFRRSEYRSDKAHMPGLAHGQRPDVLMVGCSDSRVDPALICNAQPGEIFTIRNVANLVPPFDFGDGRGHGVRAAIEYGVKALKVSNIVVFGHAHCGGIKAAIDTAAGEAPAFDFIGPWLTIAKDACEQVLANREDKADATLSIARLKEYAYLVERQSVLNSIDNLKTYSWIRELVDAGELQLHGWWFDLETGDLWVTHPETGRFLPVEGH
jgi:carbonic anhydrase